MIASLAPALALFALVSLAAAAPVSAQSSPPPAPAAAPDRADSAGSPLRVPPTVGEFSGLGRRDFPDPRLGSMFRYRTRDSLVADVYVYPGPGPMNGCDSACADGAVRREGEQFVSSIPEAVRRGYYTAATVVADSALAPVGGAAWVAGRHVRLAVDAKGTPTHSDFYLHSLPGVLVKVRASYPAEADVPRVERFTAELVRAILESRGAPRP